MAENVNDGINGQLNALQDLAIMAVILLIRKNVITNDEISAIMKSQIENQGLGGTQREITLNRLQAEILKNTS